MATDNRLIYLIGGSFLVSLASLGVMYAGHLDPFSQSLMTLSLMGSGLLAVGWLAMFLYALVAFGKRGFWVLLGGAPALWVIFIFLAIPFARL